MTIQEARREARRRGWRIETGAAACQIRSREGDCLAWDDTRESKDATVIRLVGLLLADEPLEVPR